MENDHKLRFRVESLTADPWGERTAHFLVRNERLVDLLARNIPNSKNLGCLDLGCGTGVLSNAIGKLFQFLHGCDSDQRSIQLAQKPTGGGREYYLCALPNLPSVDHCDVVTCFGAIYYLTDDEIQQLCINLHDVLNNDGLFVVANCSPTRREIIERNGFCFVRTDCYLRPKIQLHGLSERLRQWELLKAVVQRFDDPDIRDYCNKNKNRLLKIIEQHQAISKYILRGFDCLWLPVRWLVYSKTIYKKLESLGTELCPVHLFRMAGSKTS